MIGPWRRHRRARPTFAPEQQAATWQSLSLLLDYPQPELFERLDLLRQVSAELPDSAAAPITTLVDRLAELGLPAAQTLYVDTFDITRKCSLHLTFFTHGDTRNRGVALVQFKQAYRKGGADFAAEGDELPDHLCVLLEFGALHDSEAAWKLLNDHRVGIELLYRALTNRESPWLGAIEALRATLPDLGEDDQVALAKLIAQGPPSEEVGIDNAPYAMHDPAIHGANPAPPGGAFPPSAGAPPTSGRGGPPGSGNPPGGAHPQPLPDPVLISKGEPR